jgi:mannan endo-1,4-beta-mannosidase
MGIKKKLFYTLLKLIVFFSSSVLFPLAAQEIITIDDFNDNVLSEVWSGYGNTFAISESDQVLNIQYNRTDSSYEWDQFSVGPGLLKELTFYSISLDIRSDVSIGILLKPVYSDGTSDWLEAPVSGDTTWQNINFRINSLYPRTLSRIYIYFDAGSKSPKKGNVSIDNLAIINKAADISSLTFLREKAQKRFATTEEGNADGNIKTGAKVLFAQAISEALAFEALSPADQTSIDSALTSLSDAYTYFESQVNIPAGLDTVHFNNLSASRETKLLFSNLKYLANTETLFGMQDPVGYGVGWSGDNDRSDIKDVCGSYPALAGWDISNIAKGGEVSGDLHRYEKFYNLDGVNTVFWIPDNPFGGSCMWEDRTTDDNAVAAILPGGPKHAWFTAQLDNIARFFHLIKGDSGVSIPVIFRPFHEHTDNWFWWGNTQCTEEEYKELYRFTFDYLVNIKKVNNMLMAYSPAMFYNEQIYFSRYPGDEYIDILGYDNYYDLGYLGHIDIPSYVSQTRLLVEMAEARGKIPAITECGNEGIKYNDWFSAQAWGPISNDLIAKRIAYLMIWRNLNADAHWAPYPGHPVVPDFIEFYNDSTTLFIDDMPAIYDRVLQPGTGTTRVENSGDNMAIFYPNPSKGTIQLPYGNNLLSVEINDLNGRCLIQKNETDIAPVMDLSFLENGTYILVAHFRGNIIKKSLLILIK